MTFYILKTRDTELSHVPSVCHREAFSPTWARIPWTSWGLGSQPRYVIRLMIFPCLERYINVKKMMGLKCRHARRDRKHKYQFSG